MQDELSGWKGTTRTQTQGELNCERYVGHSTLMSYDTVHHALQYAIRTNIHDLELDGGLQHDLNHTASWDRVGCSERPIQLLLNESHSQ